MGMDEAPPFPPREKDGQPSKEYMLWQTKENLAHLKTNISTLKTKLSLLQNKLAELKSKSYQTQSGGIPPAESEEGLPMQGSGIETPPPLPPRNTPPLPHHKPNNKDLLKQIKDGKQLRKTIKEEKAASTDDKSVLGQIKKGVKLKPVTKDVETNEKKTKPISNAVAQILKRREALEDDYSEQEESKEARTNQGIPPAESEEGIPMQGPGMPTTKNKVPATQKEPAPKHLPSGNLLEEIRKGKQLKPVTQDAKKPTQITTGQPKTMAQILAERIQKEKDKNPDKPLTPEQLAEQQQVDEEWK
jgi:hypothetical protein